MLNLLERSSSAATENPPLFMPGDGKRITPLHSFGGQPDWLLSGENAFDDVGGQECQVEVPPHQPCRDALPIGNGTK
jgi:hypothetical protein